MNDQSIIDTFDPELRRKVEALERETLKLPQIEIPLRHHFSDGIYAREMTVPAGAIVTGRIHKHKQLNILSKGDVTVTTHLGLMRVQAPFTLVAPPGTKRAMLFHEESVWTTILRTDLTDPDEIEDKFTLATDKEYLEYAEALMIEDKTWHS